MKRNGNLGIFLLLTIVAFVLSPFRLASAGGPCEPASANSIGVPEYAQDGDLINYTYTCSIPVAPIPCDATLTEATFFKPDNPPNDVNQCDATNGLALPAPAVTLAPGEFIRFSAVDNPAIPNCGAGDVDCEIVDPNLQYTADHADENPPGTLTAFGCCKFSALPGGEDTQAQAEDQTQVLHPNITIDKDANPATICEGRETDVIYTYEVQWDLERDPPGDTDVVDVMVTDDTCAPVVRGLDNPGNDNDTLEEGEVFTFSCTTTLSSETTNTATATAVEPNLERQVEASDDFTVTAEVCDVSIDKTCINNDTEDINEISIEVCNDGTVQLENCMVSDEYFEEDPECPGEVGPGTSVVLDCPAELSTLDAGECQTCTGTIDPCVEMDTANNASVTCDVVGIDQTVGDDDCDECEPCCEPDISIVKTAGTAPDGVLLKVSADPDGTFPAVVYHYEVCNTNTCDLTDVTVTDDNGTPGDPSDDFTIPVGDLAGESFPGAGDGECVTVDSDPIDIPGPPFCADTHVNDACATGTGPDGTMVEDCDPAEVCFNCFPDITIVKTAEDAPDGVLLKLTVNPDGSFPAVVYHYEVCNTGTCALSNVTVTDDNGTPGDPSDDFTIPVGDLAVDECMTVDSDAIDISDPPYCANGTHVNDACATGTGSNGMMVEDCDPAEVCFNCPPDITIVKTAGDAEDGVLLKLTVNPDGSFPAVEYHYEVCNTGLCPLTDVTVTDDNGTPGDPSDDFTIPVGDLAVGECMTVDSDAIDISDPPYCANGTHVNDACATGTGSNGMMVEDCDPAEVCFNCPPDITIVKTAGDAEDGVLLKLTVNPDGSFPAVEYHYEVCNTGLCPLTDVTVTDDNGTPGDPSDDFTIPVGDLAVGECTTVDSDAIDIPDPPYCANGTHENDACATGTAPDGMMVEDCDPAEVCFNCPPDITIVKTAGDAEDGVLLKLTVNPDGSFPAVEYHYEVCNTGLCPLTDVTVTDDNGTPGDPSDDFTIPVGDLAVGECMTVDSDPIDIPDPPYCANGTHENDACATGTAPDGMMVEDCDPAEVCFNCPPDITIVKTAGDAEDGVLLKLTVNPDGSFPAVEYHYEVCNTGLCPLTDVTVTDDNGTPGDPSDDFTIPVGDLAVGECTTVDSDPIDIPDPPYCANGTHVNDACATGTAPDGMMVEDCDPAEVCFNCPPDISIVKTAGEAEDGVLLKLTVNPDGSFPAVEYHYEVCNTGLCPLTDVTVTDDNGTPGDPSDDFTIPVGDLAVGECTTVDSDPIDIPDPPFCFDGTHVNDACVTGTAPDGTMVDDCDPAEVCFNCTPEIEIVKTAGDAGDGQVLEIQPGDEVIFHYEVCNTGTCDLINVEVTDDHATPGDPSDDFTITIGFLAAGDCTMVDSDPMIIEDPPFCDATSVNTACVTGEAPDGAIVNDCDDAELCTPEPEGCRVTGGGNMNQTDEGGNRYTWGGQAGAPTADQPQPCGEWTHRQHQGPDGKWTFHAGTASAPPGTEIDFIECCDPGFCHPARPAAFKQITFDGVGTFKNIQTPPPSVPGYPEPDAGDTFHWFEVHIEDLGEPGSQQGEEDSDMCPVGGFNCQTGNCGCLDFYHFTLYAGSCDPNEPGCTNAVMYEVLGYLDGGNHQIHPQIPGEHNCGGPNGGGNNAEPEPNEDGSDQTIDAGQESDEPQSEYTLEELPFIVPVQSCTAGLLSLMLLFVGLVGLRLTRSQ